MRWLLRWWHSGSVNHLLFHLAGASRPSGTALTILLKSYKSTDDHTAYRHKRTLFTSLWWLTVVSSSRYFPKSHPGRECVAFSTNSQISLIFQKWAIKKCSSFSSVDLCSCWKPPTLHSGPAIVLLRISVCLCEIRNGFPAKGSRMCTGWDEIAISNFGPITHIQN